MHSVILYCVCGYSFVRLLVGILLSFGVLTACAAMGECITVWCGARRHVAALIAPHGGRVLACVCARCAYAFPVWAVHTTNANRYASRDRVRRYDKSPMRATVRESFTFPFSDAGASSRLEFDLRENDM